jgi:pimeloyl-ACP methyl ester carboxylesterase
VDYPGYGACAGKPSPKNILSNTRAAVAALAAHLADATVNERIAVYGHSLGAAAVLQYAAVEPVRRVVCIAPFTTMRAMARRRVGWPLCTLLDHNFDNEACVTILRQREIPMLIVHGTEDRVIPVEMGRRLAEVSGAAYIEVPGAGHVDITDEAEDQVRAFMNGVTPASGKYPRISPGSAIRPVAARL